MKRINVPTREQVSKNNQEIFDNLKNAVGFVPNLYATLAYSENALGNYLQFQNGKTSLSKKEKEVVNLAVSQVNGCDYCLSAHTAIAKMNGFSEEQVLELRQGYYLSDTKFDSLAKISKQIVENKGRINDATLNQFFDAGYSKETLIDVLLIIGDKTVMNYLHNLSQVEIDFPVAQKLEPVEA